MNKKLHYRIDSKEHGTIYMPNKLWKAFCDLLNPKNLKKDEWGDYVYRPESSVCNHDCYTCPLEAHHACKILLEEAIGPIPLELDLWTFKVDTSGKTKRSKGYRYVVKAHKALLSLKKCYR